MTSAGSSSRREIGCGPVLVLEGHDRLKALRDPVPELLLAGNGDGLAIAQLSGRSPDG